MKFWEDMLLPAIKAILNDILRILPNFFAAFILLLIGWIAAKMLDSLASRLLKRFGFNKVAERAGISSFLKNAGFTQEPSWIVGKLVFWMLMLTFLLSAAETLQLDALALTLQKLVAFMPNLVIVVFIIVFGAMLARFLGRLVQGAAVEAGIEFASFLGRLVRNVVIAAIFVIAISQLEIRSAVIDIMFAALLGAGALAIALTLGMGTQNISKNIISGVYARKTFQPGQVISLNGQEGEIVQIGTVNTVIHAESKDILVPNTLLLQEITEVKK